MGRSTLSPKELPSGGTTGQHLVKQSANEGDTDWETVSPDHTHSNLSVLDGDTASYTTEEETKLSGIEASANNYSHPANHLPAIITQDVNSRFVTDVQISSWDGKEEALGFTPENVANKGNTNGYAPLDGANKVPTIHIPTSPQNYLGTYDILTNTPVVINGTGTNGDYFKCSTSGTRDFGAGNVTVSAGDSLIYNGAIWEDIPSSDLVQSVAGKVGVVTLDSDDLTEATNLFYTESRVNANTNVAANTMHRSSDGKGHSDVVLNNSHRSGDGSDHSNVALNDTHRGSDGKDHSDVVLNTAHLNSDGKNHSDVGLNNAHRVISSGNPHTVTKSDVSLGNVDNLQQIPLSQKAVANGVATLDAGAKIPTNQLPASVMEYKGSYNIITNTPTLIDGTGGLGDTYKCSIGGTRNFGSGNITVVAGDALIYSGAIWEKIPGEDIIQSVAGKVGIVVLDTDDVAEGTNEYYTEAKVEAHVFDSLQLNASAGVPSYSEGLGFYDPVNKTWAFYTDIPDFLQQLGQEITLRGFNRTGITIPNGTPVYKTTVGSEDRLTPADSSSALTSISTIGLTTHAIPNDTEGIATRLGTVRDVNTTSFSPDAILYLAVGGGITDIMPSSPNYSIILGNAGRIHATLGKIDVSISIGGNTNDVLKIFNGNILEDHLIDVSSNGTTTIITLEANGGGDLSLFFDGKFTFFEATPAASVNLTSGSDTTPTLNYVFIPKSTGVLTSNTTGIPTNEQVVPVAEIVVQSAASVQIDGVYKCHAWTDHLSDIVGQGHITHVNKWIRRQHATWIDGVSPNTTIVSNGGAIDNVFHSSVSGNILQLHEHSFPAIDMQTGDSILVINDSVTPYRQTTDLSTADETSLGASLRGNNTYYSLIIWGIVNESTQNSKILCNLPSGSYSNSSDAISDPLGLSNFTIPDQFKGVGFFISRIVLRYQSSGSGTITELLTEDLRGLLPSTGPGSGGATAGTEFSDNLFRLLNVADSTKQIEFDASAIATSTTRKITMPDNDVDLGAPKTGTIASPPSGLAVGEFWRDTTDSATHPIIRISTVTT